MKKKFFLLVTATLVVVSVHSQIKVGTDGHVSMGPCEPSTGYQLKVQKGTNFIAFSNGSITSSTSYYFKTEGYSFSRMVINYSNGYVGINKGPYSPEYTLDVSGNIRATGTITSSDVRFKDEIKDPKQDEINLLYNLKAKQYKLKKPEHVSDHKDFDKEHYGFIAQEFREFYPELVYEDSLGYLSINYIELIPMLVEALKVQNGRIESLETKVKDVKLKNSGSDEISEISESVAQLMQNKPNPFSENTEIEFYLPENVEKATLTIYDLQGKQVKSITVVEREYGSAVIYGSELQPGIYHYSLIADGEIVGIEKMILTD